MNANLIARLFDKSAQPVSLDEIAFCATSTPRIKPRRNREPRAVIVVERRIGKRKPEQRIVTVR